MLRKDRKSTKKREDHREKAVHLSLIHIFMKYAGFIGLAIILVVLILIPQLQYRKHPDTYFLCVEDYEAYKDVYKRQSKCSFAVDLQHGWWSLWYKPSTKLSLSYQYLLLYGCCKTP